MKTQLKVAISMVMSMVATSCATTHPGRLGTVEKGDLHVPVKLSADVQSSYSDDHYTFVSFTVENLSDQMIRIKSTDLNMGENDTTSSVLVGNDLVSWADAEKAEQEKAKANKKITRLILLLGGASLGINGLYNHDRTLEEIGFGAMAVGVDWTLSSKVRDSIENGETPPKVPQQHIYTSFSVPAGKFVRKWAVIQHPPKYRIPFVDLTLMLEDGSEATYAIALN